MAVLSSNINVLEPREVGQIGPPAVLQSLPDTLASRYTPLLAGQTDLPPSNRSISSSFDISNDTNETRCIVSLEWYEITM